jgi:hypothetical protein
MQQRTTRATSPMPWTSPLPVMDGVFVQGATDHLLCHHFADSLALNPGINSPS